MDLKKYPKELVENRGMIECQFIACIYKSPELLDDYKTIENGTDIISEDGVFYYALAQGLYKAGYRTFDHITIASFLEDKKEVREQWDRCGGYEPIKDLTELIDEENVDGYYKELMKRNMLMRLHDEGFDVITEFRKLIKMSADEIFDYFEYKLSNVAVSKINKITTENLSEGYEEYIDLWDSGKAVGYPVGFPSLNYRLAGVHKKNLLLHLAHIGNGKTTSAILFYILPAIKSGENVCVIANEQDANEWRMMLLSTVLFNEVGNATGMNRHSLISGHFTDEQRGKLLEAQEWLKKQKGKVTFVEMPDYSINEFKKIIKKYSRIGVGLYIVDTLKPENESSERAWAEFSEVAKELFQTAKKEDVAIVATAQLSSESMSRKYLDLSCIGKSRAIAETATQVVAFRTLSAEEKEKVKPYWFAPDANGRPGKVKTFLDIDPEDDYVVLFTPKNRFGEVNPQLLYKRNMSFNTMKEVGYVEIPFDGFGRR